MSTEYLARGGDLEVLEVGRGLHFPVPEGAGGTKSPPVKGSALWIGKNGQIYAHVRLLELRCTVCNWYDLGKSETLTWCQIFTYRDFCVIYAVVWQKGNLKFHKSQLVGTKIDKKTASIYWRIKRLCGRLSFLNSYMRVGTCPLGRAKFITHERSQDFRGQVGNRIMRALFRLWGHPYPI